MELQILVALGLWPAVEPGILPGGKPNALLTAPGGGTRALYGSRDGYRYSIRCQKNKDLRNCRTDEH